MNNVDTLVIFPPRSYTDGIYAAIFPGEISIATILEKNGISARFFDADFVHKHDKVTLYPPPREYLSYKNKLKKFLKGDDKKWKNAKRILLKTEPKIILISPRMISVFSPVLFLAKLAKKIIPEVKVGIVEHLGSSSFVSETYLRDKNIDFAIRGEPEYTSVEVCERLLKGKKIDKVKGLAFRKNETIVVTKSRGLEMNLDKFPISDRDLVIDKKYFPSFSFGFLDGGRGCRYNCSFCHVKPPLRLRNPKNVIREIMQSYLKYGTREFFFAISSFLHSKKWAKEICELIKKEKLDIIWGCYSNANQIDDKILCLMKSAGCNYITVGFESGSYDTLKRMNKISNLNLKEINSVGRTIKSHGIFLRSAFIMGYPEETMNDINSTLNLISEILPDFLRLQLLVPTPSANVYKLYKKRELIRHENYDYYLTSQVLLKTKINPRTLKKIWKKYSKISGLSESILMRKKLLQSKFLRCKMVEYYRYMLRRFITNS